MGLYCTIRYRLLCFTFNDTNHMTKDYQFRLENHIDTSCMVLRHLHVL